MIQDWLLDECQDYKGKALQQPGRIDFYPTATTIITMMSQITRQQNDQKIVKEFTDFIHQINKGKGIRWSKVISVCLAKQLSEVIKMKRFYMNSYLIFLLLHGKNRKFALANMMYLNDKDKLVQRSYPKFLVENRWDEFKMMNERFECWIYKEISQLTMDMQISTLRRQLPHTSGCMDQTKSPTNFLDMQVTNLS